MKLSISLPDAVALEIKQMAERSERPVSWWIQKAWTLARDRLRLPSQEQRAHRRAMKLLHQLRGSLKTAYPNVDSVTLAHQAFRQK